MGQREESELSLKSYSEQRAELASKRNSGAESGANAVVKNRLNTDQTFTQVKNGRKVTKVVFRPGEHPQYKRRLGTVAPAAVPRESTFSDGELHVGDAGWQLQQKVQYVLDPAVQESYITTAAVANQKINLEGKADTAKIGCYDLDENLKDWLGVARPHNQCKVRSKIYVLSDAHSNLVRRLTILDNVIFRVVDSLWRP